MQSEEIPTLVRNNYAKDFSECPENGQETMLLHEAVVPDLAGLHAKTIVPYLSFRAFDDLPFLTTAFSTRLGGVSSGFRASMDLGFHERLDCSPAEKKRLAQAASENFRRMGKALGISPEKMVYSDQTHTVNVMTVSGKEAGMGVVRPQNYKDVDALMTNEHDLCLVTAFADCNPVLFADKTGKAIAAAHAGWRGTVNNIADRTVKSLHTAYGCQPQDLIVQIGPGICGHCYEVREDVANAFRGAYSEAELAHILVRKDEEHFLLNLFAANYYNCRHAGIPAKNIFISDLCTFENPQLLFSHRASHGKRGILCAFMMLK